MVAETRIELLTPDDWPAVRAIYAEDAGKPRRKSHENQAVLALYDDFLGKPLGHLSHELLHTHYTPRGRFNELTPKGS